MNRKELGNFGEKKAAEILETKGYKILTRNYKCKMGELDIIARKGYTIVFVEVKTRSNLKYGIPAEAVNNQKRVHMHRTATYYMTTNRITNVNVRFDVIEIYINHIEQVF